MTDVPIAQLSSDLYRLFSPPRRAKSTRRQIVQVLREFAELPEVRSTADLTPVSIAAWMDAHPTRTPVRTKSLLASFRSACKYAVIRKYLDQDPFDFWSAGEWIREDYVPPETKPRPVRHRSVEQISRVLARADAEAAFGDWFAHRLRAMVYLFAFTGMRAGEGYHLAADEVHVAERYLHFQAKPTWSPKTLKSAAPIGLNETLAAVLAEWLPLSGSYWAFPTVDRLRPWKTGGPGFRPLDQIKALGDRAGVPGLTIIGFRKTIGTLAKEIGISELERKNLLRHTDVKTGMHYDEADADISRRIVAKLPFHPRLAVAG